MRVCDTPYCEADIPQGELKKPIKGRFFCSGCRSDHSLRVLTAQADHELPIKDILLEASTFQSAGGMADYIGVSFVTVYNWISKYYSMTFQEFRRQFICKSSSRDKCYVLDIRRSSYSRHDYVLKKIRARRFCACINTLDDSLIMTNAPLHVVQEILRGRPEIKKINDDTFALVPSPVNDNPVTPVYFDQLPKECRPNKGDQVVVPEAITLYPCPVCGFKSKSRAGLATHKRTTHVGAQSTDPLFFEKLLISLYNLGGSSEVDALRRSIVTVKGEIPRKNNTRREVYRHPDWLGFDPSDDQVMALLEAGRVFVETELKGKYPQFFTN